ncbi:MAG: succinate dehydrogenase cytochrome b subunit [Actinomycetota bacterium]
MTAPATTKPKSSLQPLRKRRTPLPFPLNLYQTAVGKKWVMAVTGVMLLGFVLFHMAGNLKLYIGAVQEEGVYHYDADIYGEWLRDLLVPLFPRTWFLWLLRFGLIGAFALHIHAMYSLTRMNQSSNKVYSSKRDWLAANFASRSMRYSGILVLAYLLFHLADLTWGWIPGYDWERGHVHENVIGSLSNPVVAAVYIAANVLLSIHIFHGAYSMFQSLGVSNPTYNRLRRQLATALAAIVLIGNVSFPVAVLTGVIDTDDRVEHSVEAEESAQS